MTLPWFAVRGGLLDLFGAVMNAERTTRVRELHIIGAAPPAAGPELNGFAVLQFDATIEHTILADAAARTVGTGVSSYLNEEIFMAIIRLPRVADVWPCGENPLRSPRYFFRPERFNCFK